MHKPSWTPVDAWSNYCRDGLTLASDHGHFASDMGPSFTVPMSLVERAPSSLVLEAVQTPEIRDDNDAMEFGEICFLKKTNETEKE